MMPSMTQNGKKAEECRATFKRSCLDLPKNTADKIYAVVEIRPSVSFEKHAGGACTMPDEQNFYA